MRALAVAILTVLLAGPATAKVTLQSPLGVDGSVWNIVPTPAGILVTGDFDRLGDVVGGGVLADPATGALDRTMPTFEFQVSDAIADGEGGWYAGGDTLQRLSPAGRDTRFDPPDSGFVSSLARGPAGLYAGNYYGGVTLLDPQTGKELTGFDAQLPSVTELELTPERLYVGAGAGVTAVDPRTGEPDAAFDCTVCRPGPVTALAHHGSRLYVGTVAHGVVAVDAATGAIVPGFAPSPNTVSGEGEHRGPLVFAIDGDRLIVGGRNLHLGGPSPTLAALDLDTGTADPGFGAGFGAPVHDLLVQGDSLIAGGARLGSRPPALTTLDRATGAVRSVGQTELDGAIDALAPAAGGRVFLGGRFAYWAPIRTHGTALLDRETGRPLPGFRMPAVDDPWRLEPPLVVNGRIVLRWGGYFPDERHRVLLREYDLRTGDRIDAFRPPTIAYVPVNRRSTFEAVVRGEGNRIYVGHVLGDPSTIWPRSRIHVLNALTGEEQQRYDLPLPGYLTEIVPRGDRLIVTGSFRRYFADGRPRHLATLAIDALGGRLHEGFDAHTNGPVYGAGAVGDRLYLTGLFDRAWGRLRRGAAAVFASSGYLDRDFRPHLRFKRDYVLYGSPNALTDDVIKVPFGVYLQRFTGAELRALRIEGAEPYPLVGLSGRLFGAVSRYSAVGAQTLIGFLPEELLVPR